MPFVNTNNAKIYYETHGEGSPIVLAHGAGGNTLVWWQQIAHFAADYKVVAFDHRGWGRSKCAPEHKHARHFADDMRAVMDDAGVERAAIVCQSMGGWTGMQFTLANPKRVSCLVLSGTPGGVETPAVIRAREARARSRTIDLDRPVAWNEPHQALAPDAFDKNPAMAFLYRQMSGLNPPIGDTGTGEIGVLPSSLSGYSIPTLMIAGAQDRIFPLAVLKEVSEVIPGAQLYIAAEAGHSPTSRHPKSSTTSLAHSSASTRIDP